MEELDEFWATNAIRNAIELYQEEQGSLPIECSVERNIWERFRKEVAMVNKVPIEHVSRNHLVFKGVNVFPDDLKWSEA